MGIFLYLLCSLLIVRKVAVDLHHLFLGVLVVLSGIGSSCDLFVVRKIVVYLVFHDHFLKRVRVGILLFVVTEDDTLWSLAL